MWMTLNNPFHQPLHFLGLELLIVAAFALTLRDALRRDRASLFQWLTAFCYGITMELIAFNYLDNYEHGQFTIQLYRRQLPLYVVCLYPVFHYTGYKLIERWHLRWFPEALLTGLTICLIDVPFDVAGVRAGWWRWAGTDPNLAVRWLGVPLTSYYWYLAFGAVYAALGRLGRRLAKRPLALAIALAPLAAVGVIALGTLAFQPFHALVALGVRTEIVVAVHVALCAALAVALRPRGSSALRDPSLRPIAAVPLVLGAWHLAVLAAVGAGAVPIAVSAAAALGAAALAL